MTRQRRASAADRVPQRGAHVRAGGRRHERHARIASASTVEPAVKGALPTRRTAGTSRERKAIGKAIAERLIGKGVKRVVFDRNGFLYHGRVKAVADAAREAGLEFWYAWP